MLSREIHHPVAIAIHRRHAPTLKLQRNRKACRRRCGFEIRISKFSILNILYSNFFPCPPTRWPARSRRGISRFGIRNFPSILISLFNQLNHLPVLSGNNFQKINSRRKIFSALQTPHCRLVRFNLPTSEIENRDCGQVIWR